ncbi:MAG: hypothetical protein H6Q59_1887 [Firmicutes bacterium]|nr:hypothetical protein [Bacillota bacterium]
MTELRLCREDIYQGSLILINKEFDYKNTEKNISLVPADTDYPEILLECKASSVLARLMKDTGCEKEIVPISGYRSLQDQTDIYRSSMTEYGAEFTTKYVALPNHSEHQSGLAIDLAKRQPEIDFIRPYLPYEGRYGDFRRKAPDYGFIERYQSGKEKITGIAHEPWHFRYIGWPHSKIMAEQGLSLEEYIILIREYPYKRRHLVQRKGRQNVEIFFLPMGEDTEIDLPEHALIQQSGNNVDGVIITMWRKDHD